MKNITLLFLIFFVLYYQNCKSQIQKNYDNNFGAEFNPTGNPIGGGAGYTKNVDACDAIIFNNITVSNETTSIKFIIESEQEFLDALIWAKNYPLVSTTIYIPFGVELDFTSHIPVGGNISIEANNLTIAGDRGKNGSFGALIGFLSSALQNGQGETYKLFDVKGNNFRITGLRISGPQEFINDEKNMDTNYSSYIGIDCSAPPNTFYNIEIDNCEIMNFPRRAISLDKISNAYIHHNFIHHSMVLHLGYGINIEKSKAIVEANIFDYCRHAITGAGFQETQYLIRYNIFLPHIYHYPLDIHNTCVYWDDVSLHDEVVEQQNQGGDWVVIHHNSFYTDYYEENNPAYWDVHFLLNGITGSGTDEVTDNKLRGIDLGGWPVKGSLIFNNWFKIANSAHCIANEMYPECSNKNQLEQWLYGFPLNGFVNFTIFDNKFGTDNWGTYQNDVGYTHDWRTGDFNGDGNLDIIEINAGPNHNQFIVQLAKQNEIGYEPGILFGNTSNTVDVKHFKIADINGDGKSDLVLFSPGYGIYVWLTNSNVTGFEISSGTFFSFFYINWGTELPEQYKFGDFNGDGKTDVVHFNTTNYKFEILLSTGTGFTNAGYWATGTAYNYHDRYKIGDLNGDGKSDIYYMSNDGKIFVYISTGSGFINPLTSYIGNNGEEMGANYNRYKVGDINGDSHSEVLSYEDNKIYVWKADANGFQNGGEPLLWVYNYTTSGNVNQNLLYNPNAKNCQKSDNTSIIYSCINDTWDDEKRLKNDLIIETGSTLTIKNKVFIPKDGKIIVEQGAKLIIDGGNLLNDCSFFWQGIEVWGNNNANQYNETNQGVVELINGAKIENAICGIQTGMTTTGNLTDLNTTGGIIKANGAYFKNCITSIKFELYHNFYGNTWRNNRSEVKNCTFETNNFWADNSKTPKDFIYLHGVEGIIFSNNVFKNTIPISTNPTARGNGIKSIDASFTVKNTTITTKTFEGLNYGIFASNTNSLKSITVTGYDFINNYTGIGIKSINNAIITSNNFKGISYINPDSETRGVGLYLEACNNYKIEGNNFDGINGMIYGTVFYSYGSLNNTIYRNTFLNLDISIIAGNSTIAPNARSVNPDPAPIMILPGLKIKCNEFITSTLADIAATSGQLGTPQGNCGTMTTTANNLFSTNGSFSIRLNPGMLPISYFYYPGTNTEPVNNYPSFPQPLVVPLSCPAGTNPNFIYSQGCPSTLGVSPNPTDLITRINLANTQLSTLNAIIDGGNTQSILNKINSNLNSGQLKNSLLAIGPYLSDTVLIAAIKKGKPLPPGILKEIITPNSPVTLKVKDVIIAANLPNGIKQEILNAQTGISARVILEQQIANIQDSKDKDYAELMQYYFSDTISKIDSVILFLKTQTDVVSKKQLVQAYFYQDNCQEATTVLNTIPQVTQEDVLFKQFYSIMASLCIEGKTIYELTPAKTQTIYSIVSTKTATATAAKSVLSLVYGERYPEIIEELIAPDNMTIRGTLYNNSLCYLGTEPVPNDTIVLLDSTLTKVNLSTQVITDANGYFKFNFNDIIFIDKNAKYTFGTQSGAVIQDTIFKTIQEWVTVSPVTLNLKKLKADFVYDTVQCFGDTLHFTNQSKYGKKPYTYLWNFGHGQTSANENPVKLFTIPGNYNISLKITDALGCRDSIQKTINIPNSVIAQFVADTTACKDSMVNITNTSTGNQLTYSWEYGNGQTSTEIEPLITFSEMGLQKIKLTITDDKGCISTANHEIKIVDCVSNIFGVLYENPFCGSLPVVNDTLLLIDENGQAITNYVLTDNEGKFIFPDSVLSVLNPNGLYSFRKKSGYQLLETLYKTISEWKALSPVSLNLQKFNKEWLAEYNHIPSLQNLSTAMDLFDNVYVLGYYAIDTYNERMILLKYNPSGELLWTREFGDYPNWRVRSNDMLIDNNGCVYVTAVVDFNGDFSNWDAVYLLKYAPSGTLLWMQYLNYIFEKKEFTTLEFDNMNNVVISASVSLRGVDIYTTKYDTAGNFVSYKTFNTGGNDYIRDMKTDKYGTIYLTGAVNNGSSYDILTIKYKPASNFYDYVTYNGSSSQNDYGENLSIDSLGNIYVTGRTNQNQPIVLKYNNNMNLQWSYTFNETQSFNWCFNSIKLVGDALYIGAVTNLSGQNGFTLLKLGLDGNLIWSRKKDVNIYWTKDYYWVLTESDIFGNMYLSGAAWNGSNHDIFTVKYLPDGTTDWTAILNYPNNEGPTDLCISPDNNVYFTGITRVGASSDRIITAKYSQCGATAQNLRYGNMNNEAENNSKTDSIYEIRSQINNINKQQIEFVEMFPNPNDGNFYFNYSLPDEKNCKFTVYDNIGKIVYEIEIKSGKNTVMINHDKFANGIYYYQVTSGKRLVKTERLVIVK